MARRRAAPVLAALVSAFTVPSCTREVSVEEAPGAAARSYIAIVIEGPERRVFGVTAAAAATPLAFRDGNTAFVLAYDQPLEAFGLLEGRIFEAGPDDPWRPLPTPARSYRLDPITGKAAAAPAAEALPKELRSLRLHITRCSTTAFARAPRPIVSMSCAEESCRAEAELGPCLLRFEAACMASRVEAGIDGAGNLFVNRAAGFDECEPIDATPLALASGRCRRGGLPECRVDIFPPVPPSVLTTSVAVAEDAVRNMDCDTLPSALDSMREFPRPTRGLLFNIVTTAGGRIAVSRTAAGLFESAGVCVRSRQVPSVVYLVEPDTMRVERVPAESCLTWIAADPGGAGIIGLHRRSWDAERQQQVFGLTRYDASGRALARSVRTATVHEKALPVGLVVAGDPPRIAIALSISIPTGMKGPDETTSRVLLFDARTLDLERVIEPTILDNVRALAVDDHGVVVMQDSQDTAAFIDVATGEMQLQRLSVAPRGTDLAQLLWHPDSRRYIVTGVDRTGGVFTSRSGEAAHGRATFFEGVAAPFSLATWPAEPHLVLVGLQPPTFVDSVIVPGPARLALFDPLEVRFLPGSVRVGCGQVGAMTRDTRGRIWAVLPWSGHVVVVSAR